MQGSRPAGTRGLVHGSREAVPGPGQPTSGPGAMPGPWGMTPGQSRNPIGSEPLGPTPAVIFTARMHGTMTTGQGQVSSKTHLLPADTEGGPGQNPGRAALGRWPWGLLAGSTGSQPDIPCFKCLSSATNSEAVATDSTSPRTEFSICEMGAAGRVPHRAPCGLTHDKCGLRCQAPVPS